MRASFRNSEGDGMPEHHNQSGVAFNKRSFHKTVFNKVCEIIINVQPHVYWRKCYTKRNFYFCRSCHHVLIYGYASILARETIYSNYIPILVFTVSWPSYGRGCSLVNNFYYITSTYSKFLHCPLVYSSDASSNVSLTCISYT